MPSVNHNPYPTLCTPPNSRPFVEQLLTLISTNSMILLLNAISTLQLPRRHNMPEVILSCKSSDAISGSVEVWNSLS